MTHLKLEKSEPFSLRETLNCGQAFRWREETPGVFFGVVGARAVRVESSDEELRITDQNEADEAFWRSYFALDMNYAALQKEYQTDAVLAKCVECASGIRVLRQDFFETLISFIISQNNNIPRIRGIIDRLCAAFGKPVGGDFAFPSAHCLASLSEEDLQPLRAGYRTTGILDASRRVAEGRLNDEALRKMPSDAARRALLAVHGVGPKVADCVMLFGLGRFETFPVDVWIRRAMAALFPDGLPPCARSTAGIAQQYIFNYARTNKLS